MGCFLGCFGGEKSSQKRRKHRVNRASPHRQRNRVQNVQQEIVITAEPAVAETAAIDLAPEVSEMRNSPEAVKQLSPSPSRSPRKRVTFNSNVTTYEHVPVDESIESLPLVNEEESNSQSMSKDDDSVASSVGSYPPNHRYHNARESDDEAEEYGDSDLDDLDDEDEDEEDYSDEEDINDRFLDRKVWSESVVTASMESTTRNCSPPTATQEVESVMMVKNNARDRSDYINSVLNPVENTTQWKAIKSKGTTTTPLLKPQKENFADFEAPFSFKTNSHQSKNANQEIAVDTSLSNWLSTPPSENRTSPRSFEDRPILGALTVEELRKITPSPSPKKSPSRSPDEMPIIGSVGSYWNNSNSAKGLDSGSATSFKGIPNTTSKYREDKKVNWHSTPFETRLDRALKKGAV